MMVGYLLSLAASSYSRTHPVRGTRTRGFDPMACAPATADVADVIDSLFGSESSRQAFARQSVSEGIVAERYSSSRKVELTYGEFSLPFFFALLQDAGPRAGERFVDVGSGCGRLVLAAALWHEWVTASGIEVLQELHTDAVAAHARLSAFVDDEPSIGLAPCQFVCGEADAELPALLRGGSGGGGGGGSGGEASTCVAFVYATCWPGVGPYLPALSETLANHLPAGSRVITVDKQLVSDEMGRWSFQLLSRRELPNYNTGQSEGFVYALDEVRGADGGVESAVGSVESPAAAVRRHGQIVSHLTGGGGSRQLTVVEQTLHTRHRPPPGVRHAETPERLLAAAAALRAAPFCDALTWQRAVDAACTPEAAVTALKRVHTLEHLRTVQDMSRVGGGFDTDTYCAPGSWEAMLDGTRAWVEALSLAHRGEGSALALARPAGHHATRSVAMGFGLVNFAAAAVAELVAAEPHARVAILDWDVHHGNGVEDILRGHDRVRYCSLHEAGGFPGTGVDEAERGPHGNVLNVPLPKGAGSDEFLVALRSKALPFLLSAAPAPPHALLICAGFDGLEADPLASMTLRPADFGAAVRMIIDDFGVSPRHIAVGLEGGYHLDDDGNGMPAALVEMCAALLNVV